MERCEKKEIYYSPWLRSASDSVVLCVGEEKKSERERERGGGRFGGRIQSNTAQMDFLDSLGPYMLHASNIHLILHVVHNAVATHKH